MGSIVDDRKWTQEELDAIPQISMWCPRKWDDDYRVHPVTIVDGIEIDENLAPLIQELWAHGLETEACCQGHPLDYHISHHLHGSGYVLFRRFDQAAELLGRIAREMDFQTAQKIRLEPCGISDGELRGAIRFAPLLIEEITELVRRTGNDPV